MIGNQHVTPRPDGNWQHIGAGNRRATGVFNTQLEAIKSARQVAINNGTSVVIHGRDGRIFDVISFSNKNN